ncbi:MAG: methionine biosynthesis protein MetW [bacterium]|nr:methionine biosynthesis protein MetW [bacterium]
MRLDHQTIADIIAPDARVLDLGCGDGELLSRLAAEKNVTGQGVEISEEAVYRCVEKGVSVFHSDIASGLEGFPDGSFDFAVLNQSLQEVRNIGFVLDEALRVARRAVIGLPNFAHVRARLTLFFRGRAPVTPSLPYDWSDSPNVRFMSMADFRSFCRRRGYRILKSEYLGVHGRVRLWPNLFALNGIFLIEKG